MPRPDLLALSPESLASLANRGLVNRAEREIAAGDGPELDEDEAGVVTGRFKDGIVARLVPGLSLRDTPCSCGAAAACRHRVAVALLYPRWVASASTHAPWSPGEITDVELESALGKRVMERARAAKDAGILIEVRRQPREATASASAARGVNSARLPTCGVRFLVPRDLAYAQCDCAGAIACEHIALAVWAFQRADERDAEAPVLTIELGGAQAKALDLGPLDGALKLARHLLVEGITNASPARLAPRFAAARASLLRARLVWPAEILDDIEAAVRAYHERSARYSPAAAAALFMELGARSRAAARATVPEAELPARLVVGADEAEETPLEHVRLISIGARVDACGRARAADVYLADPASGVVLVFSKEWSFPEAQPLEEGPDLAIRKILRGISLGALATGQLVSRDVVRLANRGLRFRRGGAQSSLTRQNGAFDALPEPLLVSDLDALERSQRDLPPRFLRPRVLTESVRVVAVGSVGDVVYHPGDQEISAEIRGADGGAIVLSRSHRRSAPNAISAIAGALASPLALRFVSGFVRLSRSGAGLEIDPILLVTERVILPDIEHERRFEGERARCTASGSRRATSAIDVALELASSCLTEACHSGLLRVGRSASASAPDVAPGGWDARAKGAAAALSDAGLRGVADRIRFLIDRAREACRGEGRSPEAAADAWITASIRVALALASRA